MYTGKTGRKTVESIKKRIKKIFCDRGYDSNATFNEFLSNNIISPMNKES